MEDGLERVTRIELALSAWEADVLPLNYTRGAAIAGDVVDYADRGSSGQPGLQDRRA
jgi:hypothetical protein